MQGHTEKNGEINALRFRAYFNQHALRVPFLGRPFWPVEGALIALVKDQNFEITLSFFLPKHDTENISCKAVEIGNCWET